MNPLFVFDSIKYPDYPPPTFVGRTMTHRICRIATFSDKLDGAIIGILRESSDYHYKLHKRKAEAYRQYNNTSDSGSPNRPICIAHDRDEIKEFHKKLTDAIMVIRDVILNYEQDLYDLVADIVQSNIKSKEKDNV